jgi:hypothetical protein
LRRAPTRWLAEDLDGSHRATRLQAVEFQRDIAGVEVEEVAVDAARTSDDLERGGQPSQYVIELDMLVDQRLLDPSR